MQRNCYIQQIAQRCRVFVFLFEKHTAARFPYFALSLMRRILYTYGRELSSTEERLAFAEAKKKEYFDEYVDPIKTAANLRWDFFDDIIDPRKTREMIVKSMHLGRSIKERVIPRPKRKQGNRPV